MIGSSTRGWDLPGWLIPSLVLVGILVVGVLIWYGRWTTDRREESQRRDDQLRALTSLHMDARGEVGQPRVFSFEMKWVRRAMGSSVSVRRYQWLKSDVRALQALGLVVIESTKIETVKNGVSQEKVRELGKVALTVAGARAVQDQRLPTIEELTDHQRGSSSTMRDLNIITNIGRGSIHMATGSSGIDAAVLLENLRSLVQSLPPEFQGEARLYVADIEHAACQPQQRGGVARRAYRALIGLTTGVVPNATWDAIKVLFERVFQSF